MVQGVVQRVVSKIPADPVEAWMGRLDRNTQVANRSLFNRWMIWLRKQPGWEYVTPRDLLVRQLQAEDQYEVLDLLQRYISSLVMRKNSKWKAYSTVKSFFMHSRCVLPIDPSFKIRGDRPPVQAKLTLADILEAYHAAKSCYRSMILFKWQSFLDNERLIYVNDHCSDEIVKQMQMGICPIRFEVPGRKSSENDAEGTFYTFIGKDAIEALTQYFETERGWPKRGEPLWRQPNGFNIQKESFEMMWLRLFRRMGKIPKRRGPVGSRYGFNLHEMRDTATTHLHVNAKGDGLDMDCIKLWCGQVGQIDPLRYDKFYKEVEYVTDMYKIAEKHLNIVTGKPQEIKNLSKENEQLRNDLTKITQDLAALKGQFETAFEKKITNATNG